MGMMTDDQIHSPVDAFSAKLLLIILRIGVFLNAPVTTGKDQIHVLLPQDFDIILNQFLHLCAPFHFIDGDNTDLQILLSAVGCRTVRDFIDAYIFIIGIDNSLLLQCRHRIPAALLSVVQSMIIGKADGFDIPQCQQMGIRRISLDAVGLPLTHMFRCGQRPFEIHDSHIVRLENISHILEKISLILRLIVRLAE